GGVGALLPGRGADTVLEERAPPPVETRGLKVEAGSPGAAPRPSTNNLHRTTEAIEPRANASPGARASSTSGYFTSIVTFTMLSGEVGGPSPGLPTASIALSVSSPCSTWPNTE